MGGAVASCVGETDLQHLFHVSPRAGIVVSQAVANQHSGLVIAQSLQAARPTVVLAEVSTSAWDHRFRTRQFGVATIFGEASAYTGEYTQAFSGHATGTWLDGVFAAQGNALASEAVLTDTHRAMSSTTACDLAERMLIAMEAGAARGGDSRCSGVPADSASLLVVDWDGVERARLSFTNSGRADAIVGLRATFEAWRRENPCGR
jgi:uncharacterized Ntn-hydrolase superfamily protein